MIRNIKNLFHLIQAFFANLIYRFPSKKLTLIGVTGTDGKTTTVHLIYEILKEAGLKVDLISTVSAPGLHTTTPNSLVLQRLLKEMVEKKIEYVVLEASSHGLDQNRLWGIKFHISAVTNVTSDHLDYHKTYENYLGAKAKLFKGVKIAVLNCDDRSYQTLKLKINLSALPASCCSPAGGLAGAGGGQKSKIVTYALKNEADFTPQTFKFRTSLPGEYNQYNCLAAIAVASSLEIPQQKIRKGLSAFKGVIGRMEEIDEGQDFRVIVDFASTANALEQTLKTLRSQIRSSSRLIVVFGSAGLRDIQKRPKMGEIAIQLADVSILTSEDPRTEDPNKIISQIAQGCLHQGGIERKSFFRITDRREAIRAAIKLAKKGDLVVLCGKGHECSICYGKSEYPWNEQEEARKALRERLKND